MPARRDKERRAALKKALQRGAYGSMLAMLYRRDIQVERALRGIVAGAGAAFSRLIEAPLNVAIASLLAGRSTPAQEQPLQDAVTPRREEVIDTAAFVGTGAERRRQLAEEERRRRAEELANIAANVGPARRAAAARVAGTAVISTPVIPPPPQRMPTALGPAMQDILNRGGRTVMGEVRTQVDKLVEQEVAFATKSVVRAYGKDALAQVALADVDTKGGPESPTASLFPETARRDAERIIERARQAPVFGKLADEVFSKQLGGLKDKIEAKVGEALQRGAGTDEIARMLRGTKAKKYSDGMLPGWSAHNLKAFVRTLATAASANAREASYAALGVSHVQLIATLDLRTTDICISIDQTIWPIGEGPRPPLHVNCRTTVAPWWGEDDPKGVGGTRASMEGPVPATTNAREWFLSRPKGEQDDILGKARAEAVRNGLPWEKLFGPGLQPLSLADLRRQGLIPKAPEPELVPARIPEPTPSIPAAPEPVRAPVPREASKTSDLPKAPDAPVKPPKRPPTPAEVIREQNRRRRELEPPMVPVNPSGDLTIEQFTVGGDLKTWSPERERFHRESVDDALRFVPEGKEKPTLWMMGGGGASGKTSVITSGQAGHPEPGTFVNGNPDEFKADTPEFRREAQSTDPLVAANAANRSHKESAYLNRRAMAEAAARKMDVVWDGTGSDIGEALKKRLEPFRKQGYRIQADYVTIPTELAIKREIARSEKLRLDGKPFRKVREDVLRNAHAEVSAAWREAVKMGLWDKATLYDNDVPLGTMPRVIARAEGNKLTILDEVAYKAFLAKAGDL